MQIHTFEFNPFAENTYVLTDASGAAMIVDPGCSNRQEEAALRDFIAVNELRVEKIVNTHCHIDHVLGNAFACRTFGVPLWIPKGEAEMLRAQKNFALAWGFPQYQAQEEFQLLENEGMLTFGKTQLQILYVPGHSPGHLVFYHAESGNCIGGDVLFRESIGRTDLPGGNHAQLLRYIETMLFALPDNTVVHPGHGPTTTIGHEKRYNPFCGLH